MGIFSGVTNLPWWVLCNMPLACMRELLPQILEHHFQGHAGRPAELRQMAPGKCVAIIHAAYCWVRLTQWWDQAEAGLYIMQRLWDLCPNTLQGSAPAWTALSAHGLANCMRICHKALHFCQHMKGASTLHDSRPKHLSMSTLIGGTRACLVAA